MKFVMVMMWIALCVGALAARADEHSAPIEQHAAQSDHFEAETIPHPIGSRDTTWAGAMVIVIIGLFVAAAAVGMVVRANMPEELPQADPHQDDEAHGAHH